MIWTNDLVKWLKDNVDKYREKNGRLKISRIQDAVESEFGEFMNEAKFAEWIENGNTKKCETFRRIKKRIKKRIMNERNESFRKVGRLRKIKLQEQHTMPNVGSEPINLRVTMYDGHLYISLHDCIKLLYGSGIMS